MTASNLKPALPRALWMTILDLPDDCLNDLPGTLGPCHFGALIAKDEVGPLVSVALVRAEPRGGCFRVQHLMFHLRRAFMWILPAPKSASLQPLTDHILKYPDWSLGFRRVLGFGALSADRLEVPCQLKKRTHDES